MKDYEEFNEDNIEDFIKTHRAKFDIYSPPENHLEKFFIKLKNRIKHVISIVPHLIKVFIATIFIFLFSILIWNNYIRKDRHEISLKYKMELFIQKIKIIKSHGNRRDTN